MKHLEISAIIIDLGGVLLNIDFKITEKEFRKIGVKGKNFIYSKDFQSAIFEKLELGLISEEEFLLSIKKDFNLRDVKQIVNAWNSMLLNFPSHRVEMLQKIRKHYKLFLLSNTNSNHYSYYTRLFLEQYLIPFESLFDKLYLSFIMGLRKPQKEFFNMIISEQHLQIHETLFIDDTLAHIQAAKKLGLNVIHITENTDFVNYFDKEGKLQKLITE